MSKQGTRSGAYDVRVLGCKVNQYEAQQIRERLETNGMHAAGPDEQADVIVVHTCAVTSMAVKKSRQAVRRLQQQHPRARVVVTGCAAAENLLSGLKDVTARIGPRENWLETFGESVADLAPAVVERKMEDIPHDHRPLNGFSHRARAILKVQDGCDIGCTFCIVPRLRRAPRDKPLAMIAEEARGMARAGFKEIVISGVSVGLYGRDEGRSCLAKVLQTVSEVPGIERIRLSSLHPKELTDELLTVWRASPKVMPHIHLPLQAGSDRVLEAMQRNYTAAEFLRAVDRARAALDDPAFNTDVIVGFPGETDEEFEQTVCVSRQAGFSRMHVFPYSRRPHTRAARMTDTVPAQTARARARRLRHEAQELTAAFTARHLGRESRVLVEGFDPIDQTCRGYTERYAAVRFSGSGELCGEVVNVRLQESGPEAVWARLIAS
jgi:threonylcarbamoyladenosine tRNA methylthiotransferase MtaB